MANSEKIITIRPRTNSSTNNPVIEFVGADGSTAGQTIIAEITPVNQGTLTFAGTSGTIITMADNVTEKLTVNSNLGLDGDIVFNGTSFTTTLDITEPTADRTITFQDKSGTVAFTTDVTGGGSGVFSDITITGSSIVFEGATDDANETTLTVADPTADRTITLPDASGTVAVSVTDTTTTTQGDLNLDFTLSAAGNVSATGDAHGLATTDTPTFAGLNIGSDSLAEYISDTVGAMVTSNTESGISVTYQDADNTLDFDVGDFSITLTGDVTGTGTVTNLGNVSFATTIAANSVALGTDTTGDYVASLVAGALIDLQNNTGEGATPTIDVDLSELTDMTAAAVGTDELVILDAGLQRRKAINEISLGLFDTANQIALGTDTTGNYIATIAGTTNQITVTGSGSETAAVTLSLPQNIHTGASPTFAGATLDNIQVGVTGTNEIDTSSGDLTIDSAGGTVTVDDNLTVTGNLTVSGTTTTINTETITLADNIIVLNSNATGTASEDAGIEVERGDDTNVVLQWNETSDYWEIASGGTTGRILTTGDEGTGNGLDADTVDGTELSAITHEGDSVALTGDVTGSTTVGSDGSISIATTIAANSVALGTDTTGDYVASLVAGALIDLQNNTGEGATPTIDVDLSELTDMTAAAVGTDELVILDAGVQRRKAINEISIGLFDTANQIALGTDTTGSYIAEGATSGNGLSGTVNSEGGTFTVTSNATSANTVSTIVFRDASGNFAANQITLAGDIVPDTDNTGNVGTATLTWADGQFTNLTINDTLTIGDGAALKESTDRADLLQIVSATTEWGGIQITNSAGDTLTSFMADGPNYGIFDDQQSEWAIYCTENGSVQLAYNGVFKLATSNTGVTVTGDITSSSGKIDLDTFTIDASLHSTGGSVFYSNATHTFTGNMSVSGNLTVDTDTLYVDSAGNNVGIGTTNPSSGFKLHVAGGAGSTIILASSTSSSSTIGFANDTSSSGAISLVGTDIQIISDSAGIVQINGTTALRVPNGTDAQRPGTPTSGMFRFNTTSSEFEGYDGTAWGAIGGGGTGGTPAITDETTNATRYVTFVDATSGSADDLYVTSTKLYFNPSSGQLNATEFNSLSDVSYKENIEPISDSLEIIKKIMPYSFDWREDGRSSYGVLAHEIEKILPELVSENAEGVKSVSYIPLIALLIDAVKKLAER